MRHLNILSIVALLVMAGCVQDTLTGLTGEAEDAVSKNTVKMVPFRGTMSGWGALDFTRSDCPEGTVPLGGAGSGTASQLGRFEVTMSHCSYFFVDPENPTYVEGRVTAVAANGDELYLTYHGTLTGADSFVDYVTVTGGTGRFENATGSTIEYGTFVFTPEGYDWALTLEGEISSVGSSK